MTGPSYKFVGGEGAVAQAQPFVEAPKGVLGISVHAAGRLALQQVLKHLERPWWPLIFQIETA